MAITGGVTLSVIVSPVVAAVTVGKKMLKNPDHLRFCRIYVLWKDLRQFIILWTIRELLFYLFKYSLSGVYRKPLIE